METYKQQIAMLGRSLLSSILLLASALVTATVAHAAAPNAVPPYPFTIPVTPFEINIPAADIAEMHTLVRLSKLPPATYESTNRSLGINAQWVKDAKAVWENPLKFSWRKFETEVNEKLPQYKAKVTGKNGEIFDLHFAAIWNTKKDAIPLVILHGWPGIPCLSVYTTRLQC